MTRLTRSATGGPAQFSLRWRREHDDVARADAVQVVTQLVHHDPVADLEGRLHGARRDGVRGHHEGAEEDSDDDREDDDRDQLDDPARGRPSLGGVPAVGPSLRPDRRRVGRRRAGRRRAGRRRPLGQKYYPLRWDPPWQTSVVSPPGGSMCTVPSAVIFDFYGTLARWADTRAARLRAPCSRPTATRSRPPSSTATSLATTASTTPSTRSARRPTRPGSGGASVTSRRRPA